MIDPEQVPKEPSKMHEGFDWVTMDLTDEREVKCYVYAFEAIGC